MLGALVLFSWCVGFLYSQQVAKPSDMKTKKNETPGLKTLSVEGTINYLYPLLVSRSVDKIIELLIALPADDAYKRAYAIIEDQNHPLEREDELQLIGALAQHFAQSPDMQKNFFSLILKDEHYYKNKKDEEPFAYVIARFGYASILPALQKWALEQGKQEKDISKSAQHLLGNFINKALYYAAHKDDERILKMIYDAGIAISKKQASRLLLTAAKSPKTVGLVIDFLKQRGADLDTVDKKKMTPLMHAVKNNKVEFAERLLKAGANPNYMADSAVGTALQLAESKGYVNLEKILRDHGAKD
jgi:hypothetical protein